MKFIRRKIIDEFVLKAEYLGGYISSRRYHIFRENVNEYHKLLVIDTISARETFITKLS